MSPRYDTPTDGISRKKFDHAMDSHIRRYSKLATKVEDLQRHVARILQMIHLLNGGDEEE